MSNNIFGKIKQIKEGVSINKGSTTISYNEQMDNLIPASKIADMPAGFLCGQTARILWQLKQARMGNLISKSEEFQMRKLLCQN